MDWMLDAKIYVQANKIKILEDALRALLVVAAKEVGNNPDFDAPIAKARLALKRNKK